MGEKFFANDDTDKALLSKIYKQFAQLNKNNNNNNNNKTTQEKSGQKT